ncbi:hypothetical protein KY313_01460 [Candidatus Woesearchaeota archaeon]|jgi:hypothetical protein|nr:hypothetical protein [Candidatus Woesearchaeota archaeon]
MKREILALTLGIFLLSFYVGQVRYNEYDPTDQFFIHTNLVNRQGTTDVENIKVTALFPELGIFIPGNTIDVNAGETRSTFNFFNDYSIPQGEHLVKVCASNDHIRNCKYRYISFR